MKIEGRELPPVVPQPQRPTEGGRPSLPATAEAQVRKVFNPVGSQLGFYMNEGTYNPNSVQDVEDYIKSNDLNPSDRRYMRTFAIGTEENFSSAAAFIKSRRDDLETLDNATGKNLMISDLPTIASVVLMGAGFAARSATMLLRASTARSGLSFGQPAARTAVGAGARIGALETAIVETSLGSVDVLNAASTEGDALNAAENAALNVAMATTLGLIAGGAIGGALGKPDVKKVLLKPKPPKADKTPTAQLDSLPPSDPSDQSIGPIPSLAERKRVKLQTYDEYVNALDQNPTDDDIGLGYAGGWFTNSPLLKSVPAPLRTEVRDPDIPDYAKESLLALAANHAMVFLRNKLGKGTGTSVHIESNVKAGEWFKALDVLDENYRKVSPRGQTTFLNVPVGEYVEKVRRAIGKDSFAPDEWYNHIGRMVIDDIPYEKMTPEEASSVQAVKSFFEKFGNELEAEGLINPRDMFEDVFSKTDSRLGKANSVVQGIIEANRRWMLGTDLEEGVLKLEKANSRLYKLSPKRNIEKIGYNEEKIRLLEKRLRFVRKKAKHFAPMLAKMDKATTIDDLIALRPDLDLTEKMDAALTNLGNSISDMRDQIDNALDMIERAETSGRSAKPNYFMRIFDRPAIEKNRDAFRQILIGHFKENPEIISRGKGRLFQVQTMAVDPASLAKRADDTIDTILGEIDEDEIDAIFTGVGKSGPLASRRLNIPNEKIKDFIVTDVKEIMIAYTNRVAPKLEYHKKFKNPETGAIFSLDQQTDYMRERMEADGVSKVKIDRFIKNFRASYDRIVGSTLKRPDAIDTKIANALRTATQWTFLTGSGVAAIADVSTVFMDHELDVIGRGLLSAIDGSSMKLSKRELNLAGAALEITAGTTHLRYVESLTNNIFNKSTADKMNNVFHTLNGLGPVTVAAKMLDGLLRGHTLIEASINLSKNKASPFEVEFLGRYNIDKDMALNIATSNYQKSDKGLYLPNTESWTDESAVGAFRSALNAGVMNRVISGAPADKPIMADGVAYIPDSLANKLPFNLPKDDGVQGYSRVESGLLALPFTFYSYSFGALSAITSNYASGSVRNKAAHLTVSMALGYSIVKYRTPEWAWDEMSMQDKLARAFDFSGLAAIYSDMAYRAISMHNDLGFEASLPIKPKFQGDPSTAGAIASLGGAPADWTYEVGKGITQLLSGDTGDGAKSILKMVPFIGVLPMGDDLKDLAKSVASTMPNRQ